MEEEIYVPVKAIYHLWLAIKATGKIIYEATVIAYSSGEAIEKCKIGSVIKELKLRRDDVDFFIRIAGHLYEGDTFAVPLAQIPELTEGEKAAIATIKSTLSK